MAYPFCRRLEVHSGKPFPSKHGRAQLMSNIYFPANTHLRDTFHALPWVVARSGTYPKSGPGRSWVRASEDSIATEKPVNLDTHRTSKNSVEANVLAERN